MRLSQGGSLKKLFHLICAVCSLPWSCGRGRRTKVTLQGSGWLRTKTLLCFPDQRAKLCSSEASQLQAPTWGGTWPPRARCGWLPLAFPCSKAGDGWRFQLARVSSSPRSRADPQPLHSYSHLASFKSKEKSHGRTDLSGLNL